MGGQKQDHRVSIPYSPIPEILISKAHILAAVQANNSDSKISKARFWKRENEALQEEKRTAKSLKKLCNATKKVDRPVLGNPITINKR
jgi:hypothetical protein